MAPNGADDESTHGESGSELVSPTRRGVLRAAGVGATGLALGGFTGTAAAEDGETPSRLHTDGRWLKNAEDEQVRLRGVATASMGFYHVENIHPKSPKDVVGWASDTDRGWYPDVLRLPVTQWDVDQLGPQTLVDDVLRPVVDMLGERGTYAMIDYHVIRPYTEAATDDSGYDRYPDDLVRNFWGTVAPAFADDDHVLYELFNEPTYPVFWGDKGEDVTKEGAWKLWRESAQPWVDMVREEAPETPIVLGSPHWTSRTNFAPEYPFDGDNLIYASHIYPSNGSPEEFDDQYGKPAEEVPVFLTEFGWDPFSDGLDQGTNTGWGQPLREWLEGYENMSWASWCFDDSWGPRMFDSPGMGGADEWTLRSGPEEHGGFVRQWLAETSEEPIAMMAPSKTEATEGDSVQFEVVETTDDDHWITDLEWEFGDGETGEGWWVSHKYPDPGQYEVRLTATNDADETTTHGLAITVREMTDKVAKADPSTTEPAVDETVEFEARDCSGDERWITDLEWDFGDGETAEGWWASHRYDESGTYTVALTATDNTGESTTHEVELTVE